MGVLACQPAAHPAVRLSGAQQPRLPEAIAVAVLPNHAHLRKRAAVCRHDGISIVLGQMKVAREPRTDPWMPLHNVHEDAGFC